MNTQKDDKIWAYKEDDKKKTLKDILTYSRKNEQAIRNVFTDVICILLTGVGIVMSGSAGNFVLCWIMLVLLCISILCPRCRSILDILDDEEKEAEKKLTYIDGLNVELERKKQALKAKREELIAEYEKLNEEIKQVVAEGEEK